MATKEKKSIFSSIAKWFREAKAEFKKVVWPTKNQLINYTLVVIAFILVVGIFVCVLDVGLSALIKLIIKK